MLGVCATVDGQIVLVPQLRAPIQMPDNNIDGGTGLHCVISIPGLTRLVNVQGPPLNT
jgi:hypothetical protein